MSKMDNIIAWNNQYRYVGDVSGSSVAFLILYVDDILLIGNDIKFLDSIKGYLNKSFFNERPR